MTINIRYEKVCDVCGGLFDQELFESICYINFTGYRTLPLPKSSKLVGDLECCLVCFGKARQALVKNII